MKIKYKYFKLYKLTKEEELSLFVKFKKYNDFHARNKIIVANITVVTYQIKKYSFLPSINEFDLFQEGVLGLLIAANNFDERKSVRFSTFAKIYVKGVIAEYVKKNNKIVEILSSKQDNYIWQQIGKLQLGDRKLTHCDCENVIARMKTHYKTQFNTTINDVFRVYNSVNYKNIYKSQQKNVNFCTEGIDEYDTFEYVIYNQSIDSTNCIQDIENKIELDEWELFLNTKVREAFAILTPETQYVIKLRWYCTDGGNIRRRNHSLTWKQIGEKIKKTPQRAQQIERNGFKKLKKYFNEQNIFKFNDFL